MKELFQSVVMRLALCGLAVSLALFALRSRMVRDTFARLLSVWRSLTELGRVAVCAFLLVGVIYGGGKTNNVNNLPPQITHGGGSFETGFTGLAGLSATLLYPPSSPNPVNLVNPVQNQSPVQTTIEDIARGYRQVCVTTNENVSYTMPTDAVIVGNWHKRGTFSEWMRLDLGGFAFPLGTNETAYSAFSVFNDGKIRPTPRDDAHEICAIGVPMLAMQGASRFWVAECDDGSKLLTWENLFLNADTNTPVNAQIQLYPNGGFATRSNDVETVYERINPHDWDGDGKENGTDANPTVCDGDFFGVANALPTNANPDAYYWLDISVTGVLGVASISITCDGPSDLGDHAIIARTNEVCHVPLLAGATYDVESNLPISLSAVSSEYATIETNSERSLTVTLPLEFSFERIQTRGAMDAVNYGVSSSPINVFPSVVSCSGGCCSLQVVDGAIRWVCSPTCTCGGADHLLDSTVRWEGYSTSFFGYAACGCGDDAPDPVPQSGPYAASVSVGFSKNAVIFEDGYLDQPGRFVPRRSSATALTIHANGGSNGGVLSVSSTNLSKLQKNSGPAFPAQSIAVPADHSITYEMNYVGLSASDTTNDVVVSATLTENGTGAISTSAASATVVKVELESRNTASANKDRHRHTFGVLEVFDYRQYPSDAPVAWYFCEGETELLPFSPGYMILNATTNETSGGHCEFRATCGGAAYTNDFLMVMPRIEVQNPRCNENQTMIYGEAGWLLLHMDFLVGPFYVSFMGVDFMEIPDESGNCPHSGYYNDVTKGGYLSHCALAGAGEWNRVNGSGYWCRDKAGRAGWYEAPWSDGWKEWPIPIGWGMNQILLGQFDAPPTTQKFTLSSNGTFTIRKFCFEATRGILDVLPTIRRVEE